MSTRPTQRSTSRGGPTGRFAARSPAGSVTEVRAYKGKVTTTGSSKAVRLGKQFFTDHPEFEVSAEVMVRSVSPGYVLMAVEAPKSTGRQRYGVAKVLSTISGR